MGAVSDLSAVRSTIVAARSTPSHPPGRDRLDSWKEIATFLGRTVRTVQRWEREQGLPVHRHVHLSAASVYAYISELEAWLKSRSTGADARPAVATPRFREGYFHYVRGRHHMRQRTRTGFEAAIVEFQQAVDVDPTWALAHATLAEAFIIISISEWHAPSGGVALARAEASRALELDPSLALAHATVGLVSAFRDARWDAAEAQLATAIAIDPACSAAYYWYGLVLMNRGRFEPATAALQQAAALDPLFPIMLANIGRPYLCAGDYDTAASYFKMALEIEPALWLGHTFLGWALEASGSIEEATAAFERAVALADGATVASTALIHAHAKAGRKNQALAMLQPLLQSGVYVSPVRIARIYTALGEIEQALAWLERGRDDGSLINNTYPRYDPAFRPLMRDPRFEAILKSRGI